MIGSPPHDADPFAFAVLLKRRYENIPTLANVELSTAVTSQNGLSCSNTGPALSHALYFSSKLYSKPLVLRAGGAKTDHVASNSHADHFPAIKERLPTSCDPAT